VSKAPLISNHPANEGGVLVQPVSLEAPAEPDVFPPAVFGGQ